MRTPSIGKLFSHLSLVLSFALALPFAVSAAPMAPIMLWPGQPPGGATNLPPETDTTTPGDARIAGNRVIRLGNVSKPTLTIYPAPADKATGTAVVICPGGAYRILAMDLEGVEVAEWLNSIGVTAAILKYRVPMRAEVARHEAPLQDAQRALGILRSRAAQFNLTPNRIGIMGFSAGGHLSACACANWANRSYEAVDDADQTSCRPDFALLIYPAYLLQKDSTQIAPEVAVSTNTPPMFLVQAENDPVPVAGTLHYYLALKAAQIPAELHVYPEGGHGYGLRSTEKEITRWPSLAERWLRNQKLLDRVSTGK